MHIASGPLLLHRKDELVVVAVALVRGTLETLGRHLDRLHPEERARFDSCKYDRRKESYLLGRLSAKAALAELTGFNDASALFIDTGVFDFPVVRCAAIPNQQVSISHCEGISVSVAFSEAHPAGIDIERISDAHVDVMRDQLSAKEEALLCGIGLGDVRGYTLLWSIKESLSKVIRTGMTIDFSLLEVDTLSATGAQQYVGTFSRFGQYQTVSSYLGDYVVSVTIPKKTIVDFFNAGALLRNLNEGHDER